MTGPLITARGVVKTFGGRRWFGGAAGAKRAVDGVDLDINAGETLAIVGESGSGKSTLARMLLGLMPASAGDVSFEGRSLAGFTAADRAAFRKAVQPIFQDPASSLNPRMRVHTTLANVLLRHRLATRATLDGAITELLEAVGLDAGQFHDRYPHQLSGGQQQRVAIARAMAVRPRLIIADEPLSSLDMSVQAQVVDLLRDLQRRHGLAYLFISHDLKVVKALANEVVVMRGGKVVEHGPSQAIFSAPQTDYTRALIAAAFSIETAPEGVVSQ